jgi:hypothetical protein
LGTGAEDRDTAERLIDAATNQLKDCLEELWEKTWEARY